MTKDKITIVALRLFLLRGYKNVSLVDAAHEIGITKGGIYHYFASKEDLLHQAIEFLFGLIEAKYEKLFNNEQSLREVLRAIIVERELEKYINELLGICPGDYRINYASFALEVMYNFPELKARLDDCQLELCKVIQHKLETAVKAGEIRSDIDTGILGTIILSLFHGQNSMGLPFATPVMRQQVLDNIWLLLAR